ncbi:MAG: DUF4157 domain-containing protein [Candidatus Sericytochromatia bacterium]
MIVGGVPQPNPFSQNVKDKIESKLGADFSDVKVHTTTDLKSEIGATSFSKSSDVNFKPSDKSEKNAELLSHELTHVVQQGAVNIEKVKDL